MSSLSRIVLVLLATAVLTAGGIWLFQGKDSPPESTDVFEAFDMVRIGHVPKGKEGDPAGDALTKAGDALTKADIMSTFNGGMMHYTIAVPRGEFERATELLVADAKAREYEFIVDPDLGPAPTDNGADDYVYVGFVSEMDARVTDRVLALLRANFGRDFDYRCSMVCAVWVQPEDEDRAATLLSDDSKQGDYSFTNDWRDDGPSRKAPK